MNQLWVYLLLLILSSCILCQFTTIAIVATNDIHGSAFPAQMQRSDTKQNYTYGGLVYMGSLIEIIKSEYPDHTLFLDSGDQFQGGIQSSPLISSGKIMNDFYNSLEVSGSAIGNHQFDFGPNFLLPYMKSKYSPSLAANLRSEKGQIQFLPNQKMSKIYEFPSGIRIGVIGLSTIETPATTNGFADGSFPQYKFLDYKDVVINQSKKLKKNGAKAVLVVAHVGNNCNTSNTYGIWTNTSKQNECNVKDEATDLIDSLPAGTIDGFLQGHRHKVAHHYYKNIPFLGSINGGYYFNVLYLRFHKNSLYETKIQGPIPVCQKVFANLGTCEYMSADKLKTAGQLIPYRFHNKLVLPHPKVNAIFTQQWLPKMRPFFEDLVQNQIFLYSQSQKECELANLVTTLMHDAVLTSDFVIINPGGLRTQWLPGIIQYQHFYNMFPFVNSLVSFDITGAQLLALLAVIQAGSKGFYPAYGLKQTVGIDAAGNHKFINATLQNGTIIQPNKNFRGLSIDFLLNGGDDFGKAIGKVYTPRNTKNQGDIKALLKKPLMDLQVIKEGSLIDPNNPRLIVVKS